MDNRILKLSKCSSSVHVRQQVGAQNPIIKLSHNFLYLNPECKPEVLPCVTVDTAHVLDSYANLTVNVTVGSFTSKSSPFVNKKTQTYNIFINKFTSFGHITITTSLQNMMNT